MPSWEQFKLQHILSPIEFNDVETWNKTRWNQWLQSRLGGNYGSKDINSVVVSTSREVIDTFANLNFPYRPREHFYWSQDKFNIFVLKLNRNTRTYDVRRLPVMFFLAGIEQDTRRPFHFHGQAEVRISRGQLPRSWNQFPLVQ